MCATCWKGWASEHCRLATPIPSPSPLARERRPSDQRFAKLDEVRSVLASLSRESGEGWAGGQPRDMSDLTLAFSPLLPWPALIGFAVAGGVLLICAVRAARRALRGARLRAAARRTRRSVARSRKARSAKERGRVGHRQERKSEFWRRAAQTDEAREALEAALAKFGDIETRVVTCRPMTLPAMTAPSCSARSSEV